MDNAILISAVALLVIFRQFQTRAISPRSLVILPLVLLALGANGLAQAPPTGALAIGALVLEAAIGVGLGALRGRSVHVWQDEDGTWWRRGTRTTAALWLGTIAVRIGVIAGARLLGDHDATSAGSIELALGVSLAAQFAVIALRCGLVDLARSLPTFSRPRSNPPTG